VTAINFQGLFSNVTTEQTVRRLATIDPSKFNMTLYQMSDQQSRDKDFESSLEWLRTYIASLQAKLNSLVEELNNVYDEMLNGVMYKRVESTETSKVVNQLENAENPAVSCSESTIVPYNENVSNFQYDPLFGSKTLDLNNSNPNVGTQDLARLYYTQDPNQDVTSNTSHHEYGASALATMSYLWMWDVDRVNASYSTTLDSYYSTESVYKLNKLNSGAVTNGEFTSWKVEVGDTVAVGDVIGTVLQRDGTVVSLRVPAGGAGKVTQLNAKLGSVLSSSSSIISVDDGVTKLFVSSTDSRAPLASDTGTIRINTDLDIKGGDGTTTASQKYQVNVTALQPNRGVYTPTEEQPDPSEITYLLKENVESDGTLSSDDTSDCKWTQKYINPYVRDVDANGNPTGYGEMSDWLQWRIDDSANNESTAPGSEPGSQSFHFTSPNLDNYLYEYVALYDDASTGTSKLNDYMGVDYSYKSGVNNNDASEVWSQVSSKHPLTGKNYYSTSNNPAKPPQNSTWQVDKTLSAESTNSNSYYFGYISSDGSIKTYDSGLSEVVTGYRINLNWSSGQDSAYWKDGAPLLDWNMSIVKPDGTSVTVDDPASHAGGIYWDWGYHYSGGSSENENYSIGNVSGTNTLQEGLYKIKLGYVSRGTTGATGGFPDHVQANLTITPIVASGRTLASKTVTLSSSDDSGFWGTGIGGGISPQVWFGTGSLVGKTWNVSSGNLGDSASDVSGFQLFYGGNWRPAGEMTRSINLEYLQKDEASTNTLLQNWKTGNGTLPSSDEINLGYDRVELKFKENIKTETALASTHDLKTITYSTNEYGTNTNDSRGVTGADSLPIFFNSDIRSETDANSQVSSTSGWVERGWLPIGTTTTAQSVMDTDNLRVQFDFDAVDDFKNQYKGWNVDDVQVVARGKSIGELISPKLDLSDYKKVNMSFFDKAEVDTDGGDKRSVWYSLDNGDTWSKLDSYGDKTSSQTTWQKNIIDLSCIAGQSNVKLKYVFETDSLGNAGAGWNIDDIQVYGVKKAATDFYYYRESINSNFVDDGTNKAEYTNGVASDWNQNSHRVNISFDQAKTNPSGKYSVDDGRVNITNTDVPMFSDAIVGYVEQDSKVYNKEKQANGFGTWDNVPKALVFDSGTGKVKVTDFKGFTRNELGQYVRTNEENNQEIYVDDAMAINLGVYTDKIPTSTQISTKSTGWVNFDPTQGWLPFVSGTCNNEIAPNSGTYEFQTIEARNTFYLDSVAANTKIRVKTHGVDSYIYINGQAVAVPASTTPTEYGSTSSSNDATDYSYDLDISKYLKSGFNTIALQSTENQGRNGIEIKALSGFPDADEINTVRSDGTSRWAVKVANNGYKGYTDTASDIPTGKTVTYNAAGQATSSVTGELYEMFSSGESKQSVSVNFSNVDKDGVGIYSKIKNIKLAVTGEPSIQSVVTADYDTSKITDSGTMWTRLKYGYTDNTITDPDSVDSMTLKPTDNLAYATDVYGKANVDLLFDNNMAIVNDASVAIAVEYYEDTNGDGEITGSEATNVKTKYYGLADLRDDRGEAFDSTQTPATNSEPYKKGYPSLTDTSQWVRTAVESGGLTDRYEYSGTKLKSEVDSDKAYDVYNNYLVVGKGRSGGSDVETNQNILTKKLKNFVDSVEFQEIFRYGLLDNIYVAASANNNRGDQITGKLILDWDWERRRVKITQGSFSAVYKS